MMLLKNGVDNHIGQIMIEPNTFITLYSKDKDIGYLILEIKKTLMIFNSIMMVVNSLLMIILYMVYLHKIHGLKYKLHINPYVLSLI